MEKEKILKKFILFFLILLFCLLCLIIVIIKKTKLVQNEVFLQENENIPYISYIQSLPQSVKEVIEKHDSKYIKEDGNNVYAEFAKNLFGENGNSNEKFFIDLVEDLKIFFEKENFYLIDEKKDINIFVKYDDKKNKHIIIFNDKEEFYSQTDGKKYVDVEKSEIVPASNIYIKDYYLSLLSMYDGIFSKIEDKLGEGKDLGNGYTSYKDDSIRVRTVPTGAAKNIIFTDKYEGEITNKINTDMTLKEISEADPSYVFGSVEDGYLGYRGNDYYFFYYEDEMSFYTYSYEKNSEFELILEQYLENKDLNKFVNALKYSFKAYDSFEYDPDQGNLHILYSTRGVEINIINNDIKNTKFFQNYYFTDFSKDLVKNGIVDFDGDTDLVEKIEKERVNNK